jgi:mannose-6-phosphate isomerase-like protein (cupin superfamily)
VADSSITHHQTGERITFLEADPLVMEDDVPAGGDRGPEHVHPSQEESFEVVSGEYELIVDGDARVLGAGDSAVVPAGTPHSGHSAEGAVLRITFTPALRWEQFVRRLFAGEPSARLVHDFPEEIRLPEPR